MKSIIIILISLQIVFGKTIFKRQATTCNTAIDLTRVAGTCNQFHRCFASGYYAIVTCNPGYEFDPIAKKCRLDNEVECTVRGNECLDETDYTRVADDCRKYQRCINGYLSVETCQDGLVYNQATKSCDWPQNVEQCQYYYWGNECDDNVDFTRVANDCTKFYRCERGWLKTESCPENLVFDNVEKFCDWPEFVKGCEHTFWGNECDAKIDLTRVANDCTKFYRCDRGWLQTETCPDNLVFDNNAKVCNWPEQVPGCEYTFWGNECDAKTDLTRAVNDCTKFYRCDKGYLKTESCPENLVFDNIAKVCNNPEKVPGCEYTFWGNECDAKTDYTRLTNDCSKYYRCNKGYLSIETCPSGLYFDVNKKTCEWANSVACNNAPVQTKCTPDQDLVQVPNDCSKFYKCINGILSVESCPAGNFFDSQVKACYLAAYVSTCTSTPTPEPETKCFFYDDLTQVPGKCNQFYRCINGVLKTETCPTGFNFDRSLRACNVANQVYTCY